MFGRLGMQPQQPQQQQQQIDPGKEPLIDGTLDRQPDDTVAALAFSPKKIADDFLASGTWSNTVNLYQVTKDVAGTPGGIFKASHQHQAPILDICWSDDCKQVFSASCDKTVKMWDLQSNQQVQVAAHNAPVRTVHWVKTNNYSCIMTSSWDKTLKFWDTRSQNPLTSINLPERSHCADVDGSLAVVCTADKSVSVYNLEPAPTFFKKTDSTLKIQHTCVAIFRNEENKPCGYSLGSIEGRVAIHNIASPNSNFTFKCHRVGGHDLSITHDIYAVNDMAHHPGFRTMATIGSDGRYSIWDKNQRMRLKMSEQYELPLTKCSISGGGDIFAFALGYDWSKGHEYANPTNPKPRIVLHKCYEQFKTRPKTTPKPSS